MALPSGIYLQYKADAITGVADGDPVNTWNDSSGNGRHATGSAIYKTNIVNGLPAVRFNGINLSFAFPNLSTLTAGEIFYILRVLSLGIGGSIHYLGASFPGDLYPFQNDGKIYDSFGRGARIDAITPKVNLLDFHVYNVYSAPNDWQAFHNGQSIYATAANTVLFPTAPLLGSNPAGNWFFGFVSEVILYNRKLTAPERAAVLTYSGDKYFPPSSSGSTSTVKRRKKLRPLFRVG